MSVQSVKWWQWTALSLLLGLSLGALRRWELADLGRTGETLNGAEAFERALTHKLRGRPLFDRVMVREQALGDAHRKTVDVVSGEYCDGNPDPADGEFHWRATVFVAPIPFQPHTLSAEALALSDMPNPRVRDYLQLLSHSQGVRYTNAWWDSFPLATWLAGTVLVLGVLWPPLVNWWFYGTLVRPAVEPGIDLIRVKNRPSAEGESKADLSTKDEVRLAAIEAELRTSLVDRAEPTVAETPTAAAPIRTLLAAAPDAPAPYQAVVEKDFAAKEDDYYPTELRRPADAASGKLR